MICITQGCRHQADEGQALCGACQVAGIPSLADHVIKNDIVTYPPPTPSRRKDDVSMSEKYPLYYKKVGELNEVDVYAVCKIFEVSDYSGCVHHSIKKLLLPGTRTGGKTRYNDIKEARDTLTRWLELHTDEAKEQQAQEEYDRNTLHFQRAIRGHLTQFPGAAEIKKT